MTFRSVLTVVAVSVFLAVYTAVLLLFSITLSGILVTLAGISAFSSVGLVATAVGSGLYIGFEYYTLAKGNGAPIAVIVLVVALMPWLVFRGVGLLSSEYSRLRDLILSLPRNVLSHLIPSALN